VRSFCDSQSLECGGIAAHIDGGIAPSVSCSIRTATSSPGLRSPRQSLSVYCRVSPSRSANSSRVIPALSSHRESSVSTIRGRPGARFFVVLGLMGSYWYRLGGPAVNVDAAASETGRDERRSSARSGSALVRSGPDPRKNAVVVAVVGATRDSELSQWLW